MMNERTFINCVY